MSLRGENMKIEFSGWYENDERIGPMKDDPQFKSFIRNDIFENIGDFLFDEILKIENI